MRTEIFPILTPSQRYSALIPMFYNIIAHLTKRARNILGIGQSDNKLINPIRPL